MHKKTIAVMFIFISILLIGMAVFTYLAKTGQIAEIGLSR